MSSAGLQSRAANSIGRPFKPGQSGNPNGRRKGEPNKINRSIKEMILTALHDVGGAEYLAQQAHANPVAFMGLVGRVLPLQLANEGGGALQVEFRWANEPPASVTIDAEPVVVSDETNGDAEPEVRFIGEDADQ